MTAITLVLLAVVLTAREFAYGQQWQDIYITEARKGMADFKKKQNEILEVLNGFEDLQQKQNDILAKLSGYGDLQQKQNDILAKLSEMQKKLGYVESNLEELHRDLELVKGAVNNTQNSLQSAVNSNQDSLQKIHQETKGCLGREDLEHFKNISSAGLQELDSFLHQEISGVISLLETGGIDECSEGSHNCTNYEACADKLFKYQCSCFPGFARDGSRCEDVDECAQGKDECSPLATCRNSVGSYSCSCNPPSEGDGQSCSCPPGFAQKGSNCEDIDECAQGKAECSLKATCRNSIGSYSCSCNPPFEGDGRTCEFPCESQAEYLEGLRCVKFVKEWKTFEEMNATCHQAGGRFLQDFSVERLQEVGWAFSYRGGWIGVQEGKWLESGRPLQEELWTEYSQRSDPSGRKGLCGFIYSDRSSFSYKVGQIDCSVKRRGYCQFINPVNMSQST
ncbi:cubilin-like isoform X3 [Macrobrachium nipponense]|uniref:cubilin-like isoform X3 n=1 Tax=Macrobrachium nipponense TaxID=159736 RepID=UPI0030C8569E